MSIEGAMRITRDEALNWLKDELAMLEAADMASPEWRDELREVIAALESPCPICGGGEVLARARGQARRLEAIRRRFRVTADFNQEGTSALDFPVEVLILPAAEPATDVCPGGKEEP
jgi:hypothetical protein